MFELFLISNFLPYFNISSPFAALKLIRIFFCLKASQFLLYSVHHTVISFYNSKETHLFKSYKMKRFNFIKKHRLIGKLKQNRF